MTSAQSGFRLMILADHWGELGGGEVVAAQLARALGGRFELAVLTTDRRRDAVERRDGLTVYRVRSDYRLRLRPLLGLVNPLALRGAWRALADFRPTVVHAWNVHQHLSYASLGLARRTGAATVLTFQDALPFCYTKFHCYIERGAPCPARPSYRAQPRTCASCWKNYWLFPPRNQAARRLIRRFVQRKVSVSRALAEALADNDLPGARVIHNGLPSDDLPPPTATIEAIRARLGLGDEVVVAGGRMGWFKGQQQVLGAFAQLAEERPRAQLVFAGRDDDWFAQSLKRQADDLGLGQRVIFSGFLPHAEFLALLTVGALFANLSLYLDPFPTVNLESGAVGRPVLGTCFGGTPEVVLDGQTGRIVNPYRLTEVAAALRALLADPSGRAALGRAAAERVLTEFTMRRMVGAYLEEFAAAVD